ncbi:MAG: hypothetical protein U5K69_30020 [Balneolaceae bacterium]|nr:hypothetical protein [Balneolaceae bacterium]
MSFKNRISKLENRIPQKPLTWDGNSGTAEAFVRAHAAKDKVGCPLSSFKGDDPEAYIRSKMEE